MGKVGGRRKQLLLIFALAVGCRGVCRAQEAPGTIRGTVLDRSGAMVAGARIRLAQALPRPMAVETVSGNDGQFSFAEVAPGAFQLTISAAGFATQNVSGTLPAGETQTLAPVSLNVAEAMTEVRVGLTHAEQIEVAEAEVKIEEKQRVLGVLPNFFVTYIPDAVPLSSRQKFGLAWKTAIDPFTFLGVAGAAGIQQAQNHFSGYGQGAQGYGKRFGAGYADAFSGIMLGGAVFPSLLKQDPRYFYKGTGSKASRALYAIANGFICKGDNGKWQPNYSNVLGSLAAGGISNIYYPAQNRDGAQLTFENAAIGIGGNAIGNLFQEFVVKKLTPKVVNRPASNP